MDFSNGIRIFVLCVLPFIALDMVSAEFLKCYEDDTNPYLNFSTKAPYKNLVNGDVGFEKPEECKPSMIWSLVRHGVRYIVEMDEYYTLYKIRDEIIYNYETKDSVYLCKKDIDNLKRWYLRMGKEKENQMHVAGFEEMKYIAQRYRKGFPEILKPPYVPGQYLMLVTNTSSGKTLNSGQAFLQGIFPDNPLVTVYPPLPEDLLIRIYTPCIHRKVRASSHENTKLFHKSQEYRAVLSSVRKKLDLKELTARQLNLIYNMCRYDKSWFYEETSPWCAVFSEEELKILEYNQDLSYHYKSGYGDEFNRELGCPLLRDMIKRFEDLDNGVQNNQPDALFYMAHSTTLYTLVTALGVLKDDKELSPSNYKEQSNRLWRTSMMGPFGANLAAVFYKCEDGDNRIALYLNEKTLSIEGCDGKFCRWDIFYEKYKNFINAKTCDPKALCYEHPIWLYVTCASVILVAILVMLLVKRLRNRNTVSFFISNLKILRNNDKHHIV